jgi:hypothetical protein
MALVLLFWVAAVVFVVAGSVALLRGSVSYGTLFIVLGVLASSSLAFVSGSAA